MELNAGDYDAIASFLSIAQNQGWNWFAMDFGTIDKHRSLDVKGFEPANVAIDFCSGRNNAFDFNE